MWFIATVKLLEPIESCKFEWENSALENLGRTLKILQYLPRGTSLQIG